MRHVPFLCVLAILAISCGCGDPDTYGGPYVDVTPDVEVDLGDIIRDEDGTVELTFSNVSPRPWTMEINMNSMPANMEFQCNEGANDSCLQHDSGDATVWTATVHTYCGDTSQGIIVIHILDDEITDGGNVELETLEVVVNWNTTECD